MPSSNTYRLTWVSLTLDMGYLLTAAPPDLERGVAPLGLPARAQPPLTSGEGESLSDTLLRGPWQHVRFCELRQTSDMQMTPLLWQKPTSREQRLRSYRGAERSYSTSKVRRGSHEEIPLVQGKEQWLHSAGTAVKRYPMTKVRETQVTW